MSTADGRVYEVDSSASVLVQTVRKSLDKNLPLHLTIEGDRIVAAKEFSRSELTSYADPLGPNQASVTPYADIARVQSGYSYTPSDLSSMSEADSLFSNLKNLRSSSQCYQRAHYWARQMYNYHSINSMKVFLFFTRKFIREHKYRWWFHVAPFVYVQGQEVVLDPEFLRTTKTMHDWTDFFMLDTHFVKPALYSAPDCTEVPTYGAFESNQESSLCYTLKLPMYYYQPTDAEALSDNGTRVDSWREWDIKHSQKADSSGSWF